MYDAGTVIAAELERLAPLDKAGPDWSDVLTRARRGARSRGITPLLVAAALAIAVPAVAFSSGVRGLLGFGRPVPVLGSAVALVSAPVGNHFYGHLWRSPSTTGGTCLFTTFDHSATAPRLPRDWRGGGSCSVKEHVAASAASAVQPLTVSVAIQRRLGMRLRDWVPPVIAGSVYPALRAVRVAVVWHAGSHDLALRNGWFIGGSRGFFLPPLRKFPFVVVAYDRSGRAVATKRLDSPSLLMLHHGWKEFTRKYNAWRLRHHP
jgi:hypothetical protein